MGRSWIPVQSQSGGIFQPWSASAKSWDCQGSSEKFTKPSFTHLQTRLWWCWFHYLTNTTGAAGPHRDKYDLCDVISCHSHYRIIGKIVVSKRHGKCLFMLNRNRDHWMTPRGLFSSAVYPSGGGLPNNLISPPLDLRVRAAKRKGPLMRFGVGMWRRTKKKSRGYFGKALKPNCFLVWFASTPGMWRRDWDDYRGDCDGSNKEIISGEILWKNLPCNYTLKDT